MAELPDLCNSSYLNIDTLDDLKNELHKLHRQFPHRFPKLIHVLPSVSNNVDSQWKQQLLQAKQNQAEEHIVFIPYNIQNFFWTGVLIKFKANGQVEQAILIDPVISLPSLHKELQKQFSPIYPGIIVRSKNISTYTDQGNHASLIMANLVRVIEEAFTNHLNLSTCSSQSNDSDVSEPLEKEKKLVFSQPDISFCNMESFCTVPLQSNDILNQDAINHWKEGKCSMTDETLRNLYDDFSSMTLCAERYLCSLIFHISFYLTDAVIVTSWTEIQNVFECLKQRLRIEEFETVDTQNLIEGASINIKRQNWKIALVILQKMLGHINPLKMNELFRYVEKINHFKNLMKGEDVIIFLGGTREDKSTIIRFLTRSEMKEIPYALPVKVNLRDIGGYSNRTVILCDSSGFESTSIPEIDIAHTAGMVKALQGCKSVKLVVLVSYENISNQLSYLRDLAKILVRMIPTMEEYVETFSYIYTRFPSNEKNRVYKLLVELKETINETNKADSSFMRLFEHMLRKTEKKAVVLDPINDDPAEILDDLIRSSTIKHPDEVFHFSMTEQAKFALQKQMRIHYTSIISATKRAEYDFVRYKLNQLKRLNELVDHASIKQVYTDCVNCISQHLLDNYQEGISSLDRDGNIHRYKICIDHAKLAEALRKEHLGEKVVHHDAFIQYLNERVDLLLADLKDKDVNDIFVKHSLDKIKLLSNSFSDIDVNKYRGICKFFSVQFESIRHSFEKSVLANDFEKSSSDMTRAFQALTVLNGHLDDKDMENKYRQMPEYLLKYLNKCVEKVNYVFVNETIDQDSIRRLTNCICLLKSAKKMFALHSHIPKEILDKIYEEFLSKIEIHFQEIAKKTHSGIKNKVSFNALEQLIRQLDSIRTISVIKQKTNQSYCSILENVVEYLFESTREVEGFLRGVVIERQKLRKSSSTLSEAQWIKKYRALAYASAMHNVKELVLQHIQEMQESVMKINLDLDSYDKIELVQNTVSEMNEMTCFEMTVPEVNEHLAKVHIYVNELIENLCSVIKESFSIEKWKQCGCPRMNLSKAENAFHYLNTCSKIPIQWKIDYMSVYDSLKEFIRDYSDCIQNEMTACYEKIKEYPNINREELFEKARILSNRLQEISEVRNKYPLVFSCFTNRTSFEQWQEELSIDLIEIEIQIETLHITQQLVLLNKKLPMLKALSKLDSCLEGKKYIDIYHKYQSVTFLQMKNIFEEVLNAIRQDDYETVAYEIVKLPLSENVGQVFSAQFKCSLRLRLDELMYETRMQAIMLGNSMELEQIKSIVKNLKKIHRAKQFVSEYLDIEVEMNMCVDEVRKLIEERVSRVLQSIKAVIIINDFSEVERRLDSITLVCAILGNYCSKMILDEIEALKEHQTSVVLKDVVEKYSKMDIKDYCFDPPIYIFAKFEAVINMDPKYIETFNKIKRIIFLKFRRELELSKSEESRDNKISHLRRFESAVKYLPETIRSALEIELKHCKDDIASLNQDIRHNVKGSR